MTNVQQSVSVDFNLRSIVSDNAGLVFNVRTIVAKPGQQLIFNVRAIASQLSALKFNVLTTVSPMNLLNLSFRVLQSLTRPVGLVFNVRTPVSPLSVNTLFNLHALAQQSENVLFNVGAPFTIVSQSVGIQYSTMINPGSTTHINTVVMNPDTVPPQYITTPLSTSLLGG